MTVQPLDDLIAALRRGTPPAGRTRVLAVDGPSGSGKSRLAGRLATAARRTGESTAVVHLEDIYPGWDGLAATPGLVVDGVLRPLAEGRPAAYPRWNWDRDEWAERREVPTTDMLILEGVGSGARVCAPFLTMLLWIDAPRDVRKARAFERDGDIYRPHWDRWAAQESTMFAAERTRERADVRVDGDPSQAYDPDREVVIRTE